MDDNINGRSLQAVVASANAGDPESQYLLGVAQMAGMGTEKNTGAAIKQFTAAANGGFKEAQFILGMLLLDTNGKEAERWLIRAESAGCAGAAGVLGMRYLGPSSGIPRDVAYSWVRRAAEGGDAQSQANLAGYLLRNDKKIEAYAWLKLAVSQHGSHGPFGMNLFAIQRIESELDDKSLDDAKRLSTEYIDRYSKERYLFCSQSLPSMSTPLQY
jgi:hypothetical protein